MNTDIDKLTLLVTELQLTTNGLVKRLTRIESRISQLMLFQGMQTDGRNPITHQGQL